MSNLLQLLQPHSIYMLLLHLGCSSESTFTANIAQMRWVLHYCDSIDR